MGATVSEIGITCGHANKLDACNPVLPSMEHMQASTSCAGQYRLQMQQAGRETRWGQWSLTA